MIYKKVIMIDIWLIEANVGKGEWIPVIKLGMFSSEEIASKEADRASNDNIYNNPIQTVFYRPMRYAPCIK
jgi:hypothetical protein